MKGLKVNWWRSGYYLLIGSLVYALSRALLGDGWSFPLWFVVCLVASVLSALYWPLVERR